MNVATRSIDACRRAVQPRRRLRAGVAVLAGLVICGASTTRAGETRGAAVTVVGVRIAPNGHMDVLGRGAPGTRVRLEVQGIGIASGDIGADGAWMVSDIETRRGGIYTIVAWSSDDAAQATSSDSLRVVVPGEVTPAAGSNADWIARLGGGVRRIAGSIERFAAETIGVRLAQAQSGSVKPPASGGASEDDDITARVRRWLDRANREYREQIVPRLSGEADRKPVPAPAAPPQPRGGSQPGGPTDGEWTLPTVDGVRQQVERWIERSRTEYHGEVVPRLSGQKAPGLPGGTVGDADRMREQAAEVERRRREAARASAAAEQRERERATEQARQASAEAAAAERQRQADARAAEERAARARQAADESDRRRQDEARAAEARAAEARAAEARAVEARAAEARAAETRAAEERAARDRQPADEATRREAERRERDRREAQRREEERRVQESAARAIAAAQAAAERERERQRTEAEAREQRATAEARAAADARRRAEEARIAEGRRQADQRAAGARSAESRAAETRATETRAAPSRDTNDPAFDNRRQPPPVRRATPTPTPTPVPAPEPPVASERQPALPVRRPSVSAETPPIPQPSPMRAARAPATRAAPPATRQPDDGASVATRSDPARDVRPSAERSGQPVADPYRPDARSALGAPAPRYLSGRSSPSGEGDETRCRAAGRRAVGRRHYVVARGDSLWRISRTHYRQGRRYRVIWRANADKIRDPDLIYPCQRFRIPKSGRGR